MLAHMGSQFVVLLFLESLVVKGWGYFFFFILEGCQQFFVLCWIIKDAMHVGAHTVVIHEVAIFGAIVQMQKG